MASTSAGESTSSETVPPVKLTNNWLLVLFQIYVHMSAAYGLWLLLYEASWSTVFFCIFLVWLGMISLTLGCHRLWAHNSYKAVWPLRVFFAACQLLSCQGSIHDWVVDHRVHHKKRGTDLDPYNHKRGFFFAHFASHCLESNADIERAKRHIVTKDLEDDKVVYYQRWFYFILMPIFGILLPINAGMAYFGESAWLSIFVLGFLRCALLLQASWFINSGYLVWGLDPADRKSGDTWLVFFVTKSHWPQYHYFLPWDYRSGEYGTYDSGCMTSTFRVFAALRWAYDLTTISSQGVKQALYEAVESKRPLQECLNEAKYVLPDIINQDPAKF